MAPAARRCGERTGQRIGHRVQVGPQQRLGLGQANRRRTGQRHRPGLGRHRSSQLPHPCHVLLVVRPDTPGVETTGADTGQESAAGEELQSKHARRAPERGGPVRSRHTAHPAKCGQGLGDRHDRGVDITAPHRNTMRPHHGQPARHRGRRTAVGTPEGHPAKPGRVSGQENSSTGSQLPEPGRVHDGRCRGRNLIVVSLDDIRAGSHEGELLSIRNCAAGIKPPIERNRAGHRAGHRATAELPFPGQGDREREFSNTTRGVSGAS